MNAIHRLSPYRPLLYVVGAIGLFGLNGVFLFYALLRPEVMAAALANPVSLVFILEALLLTGLFAWLIATFGWKRPGWLAFVALSMVGSLAFSVPAFLLLHLRKQAGQSRPEASPLGDPALSRTARRGAASVHRRSG